MVSKYMHEAVNDVLIDRLEAVSIAEPLQNRQHAQNPNAVKTWEKGKEGGRVR